MPKKTYRVELEDGTVGEPTTDLLPGQEYLIAWVNQGLEQQVPDICIYGNSKGLRRFAKLLMQVADLDQAEGEFWDDDSYHCHTSTGLNTEARERLPRLTVGRADSKNNPQLLRDFFPALVPEFDDASIRIPSELVEKTGENRESNCQGSPAEAVLLIARYDCFVANKPTGSVDYQVRYDVLSGEKTDLEGTLRKEETVRYLNEANEEVEWRFAEIVAIEWSPKLSPGEEVIGFITGKPARRA